MAGCCHRCHPLPLPTSSRFLPPPHGDSGILQVWEGRRGKSHFPAKKRKRRLLLSPLRHAGGGLLTRARCRPSVPLSLRPPARARLSHDLAMSHFSGHLKRRLRPGWGVCVRACECAGDKKERGPQLVSKGLTRWHGVPVSHPAGLLSPGCVPWVPTPPSSHCWVPLSCFITENEDNLSASGVRKGVILRVRLIFNPGVLPPPSSPRPHHPQRGCLSARGCQGPPVIRTWGTHADSMPLGACHCCPHLRMVPTSSPIPNPRRFPPPAPQSPSSAAWGFSQLQEKPSAICETRSAFPPRAGRYRPPLPRSSDVVAVTDTRPRCHCPHVTAAAPGPSLAPSGVYGVFCFLLLARVTNAFARQQLASWQLIVSSCLQTTRRPTRKSPERGRMGLSARPAPRGWWLCCPRVCPQPGLFLHSLLRGLHPCARGRVRAQPCKRSCLCTRGSSPGAMDSSLHAWIQP